MQVSHSYRLFQRTQFMGYTANTHMHLSCDILSSKIKIQHFPRQKHYFPLGKLITINMSIYSRLASSPPSSWDQGSHCPVGDRSNLCKFAFSRQTCKGQRYYLSQSKERSLVICPRTPPSLWRIDPCISFSLSQPPPRPAHPFPMQKGRLRVDKDTRAPQ